MLARCFVILLAAVLLAGTGPQAEAAKRGETMSGWFWPKAAKSEGHRSRTIVTFRTRETPGTIIVETSEHRLYLVLPGGKAIRYPVGVGKQGFAWSGTAQVGRRAEWPQWHPPKDMIDRAAASSRFLPYSLEGGKLNPLGARALYLYQAGRDTLYRIHGTNEPRSVGRSVSSGCIRMLNEDVIDLYDRVSLGTKVIVR